MRERERLTNGDLRVTEIVHDLNNLLTCVIGYARLLCKRPDIPASVKKDLERIAEGGWLASQLSDQILEPSHESDTEKQPLDLVASLKKGVEFLRETIPNISINLEIDHGDYFINADPIATYRIVSNLVFNARDAMPEGGELRIGLFHLTLKDGDSPPRPMMKPGEWNVLSVSDTGVGIPEEDLPHLFERFFTTKDGGEGLGLFLVDRLVRDNQGFIEVETEVDKGTTFTIYFPSIAPSSQEG